MVNPRGFMGSIYAHIRSAHSSSLWCTAHRVMCSLNSSFVWTYIFTHAVHTACIPATKKDLQIETFEQLLFPCRGSKLMSNPWFHHGHGNEPAFNHLIT